MSISWSNFFSVLVFSVYVVMSCAGLYYIKLAENWKTPLFLLGFLLYGFGAIIWMIILRFMPLSFAFPVASGSLVIGTMFTGEFFLNETLTFRQIFGAAMIIIGITIMSMNR